MINSYMFVLRKADLKSFAVLFPTGAQTNFYGKNFVQSFTFFAKIKGAQSAQLYCYLLDLLVRKTINQKGPL